MSSVIFLRKNFPCVNFSNVKNSKPESEVVVQSCVGYIYCFCQVACHLSRAIQSNHTYMIFGRQRNIILSWPTHRQSRQKASLSRPPRVPWKSEGWSRKMHLSDKTLELHQVRLMVMVWQAIRFFLWNRFVKLGPPSLLTTNKTCY